MSVLDKLYVMKFGGSSVAGPKEILQSTSIVADYRKEGSKLVVVCSAMGETTDLLLRAIDHAKKGDIENARKLILEILAHHQATLEKIVKNLEKRKECSKWILERFEEIDRILLGISLLKDASPKSSDNLVSFGERLSTMIFDATLRDMGLDSRYLTGGEAGILTDETFGSAEPMPKVTNAKLRDTLVPLMKKRTIPVVTGYIAETLESHEIITLGRGGSDYTATLIASALDADEVILWTDVDGIMSADPRIIKNARILEQISYQEAMEMSAFGAKSMQPRALDPAARKGIPVRIKNTFNPKFVGTLILSSDSMLNGVKNGVKAVGSLPNVGMINISGTSIVGSPGTAVKIFEILKELGVGIIMMSQSVSENNVSLVIKRNELNKVVKAFRKELLQEDPDSEIEKPKDGRSSHSSKNAKFSKLDYEDDVSIVAVLGRGMIGTPGIAGRVFSTVAKEGINIRMIAQGSSEINISFVIKDKDRNRAVAVLHEEFIVA